MGLQSDFTEADVKHLMKDKDDHHGGGNKCIRYPGRFGTNYKNGDDLSVYKVHPKGHKPLY